MVDTSFALPCHPLGVKPAGNAWSDVRQIHHPFNPIPDEVLLAILEILDDKSLVSLGATCRALYAFAHFNELWRSRCIGSAAVPQSWTGTWYTSYANIPASMLANVTAEGLMSDALYRPYLCANTPLVLYAENIPQANQICRLENLPRLEFDGGWADRPFILTQPVRDWPIFSDWSVEKLSAIYGSVVFRAEAVDWPLSTYVDYMQDNEDESPLYLFDRAFREKMNLASEPLSGDFWPPECFGDDLFDLLGEQRPDCRWLIIGPERSGSTFHKDPNATSAWNAVIRGSKYWIMFPASPHLPPPPGVFVSEDQSEVTSPLSIAEWLLGFHEAARATPGCKEGICKAGEVLHVPSGWWHLVVNLESSVAITQNFVPEAHLMEVLSFLKNKPNQVSGFRRGIKDPFTLFKNVLQSFRPELARKCLSQLEQDGARRKRKWDELTGCGSDKENGDSLTRGFMFGFTECDEE